MPNSSLGYCGTETTERPGCVTLGPNSAIAFPGGKCFIVNARTHSVSSIHLFLGMRRAADLGRRGASSKERNPSLSGWVHVACGGRFPRRTLANVRFYQRACTPPHDNEVRFVAWDGATTEALNRHSLTPVGRFPRPHLREKARWFDFHPDFAQEAAKMRFRRLMCCINKRRSWTRTASVEKGPASAVLSRLIRLK